MSNLTDFENIPWPEEDADPFFDDFEAMIQRIDILTHHLKLAKNFFVVGGGTVAWNSGTGVLSWTADFSIPILHYGYSLKIQYGPDNTNRVAAIPDGSCLVVDIPSALQADQTVNAVVTTQLTPLSDTQFVIGYRYGTSLYLRNLGTY